MLNVNSVHLEADEGNESTKNFSFANSSKRKQEISRKNDYL